MFDLSCHRLCVRPVSDLYIIGKMHHTDIREHGSGNAGTTNARRTFGKKAGALTLLGDLLKCVAAVVIVRLLFRERAGEILPLLVSMLRRAVFWDITFRFTWDFGQERAWAGLGWHDHGF